MRIYTNPSAAFNETVRDVAEMGIMVTPHTMQNKRVEGDKAYHTKELTGYGFTISEWAWLPSAEREAVGLFYDGDELDRVLAFIQQEYEDRLACVRANPGNAWNKRADVWDEFIHKDLIRDEHGKPKAGFHYTYAERFAVQVPVILRRLQEDPHTRQAIITMHSNINTNPDGRTDSDIEPRVSPSQDLEFIGGVGRIPCSLTYQFLLRDGHVHLVYSMRSCDLFTHFPIDVMMALRLQAWMADRLGVNVGRMTYFAGSLHAYHKDLEREHRF